MSSIVTVIAPINIAVIKYWGKRDEKLVIPLNDSVSATFDPRVMRAKTSICASPDLKENVFWLNGRKESFDNPRLQNCLKEIKARAAFEKNVDDDFLTWKLHIYSLNNFPTAAGLASSAAGYACLVTALAKLYKVTSDVSAIARLGSGSACRSIYGGFVRWHAGIKPDGSDSVATQIADAKHWPELRALLIVVRSDKKKVSSTKGMNVSAKTSELLRHRIHHCLPRRTEEMCKAIKERNFAKFAEITMKESNQFHAICLDSYPPIVYLNEISYKIIDLIHAYNEACGEVKAAYTFDAGPNACIYVLNKDVPQLLYLFIHTFPFNHKEEHCISGFGTPITQISPDILKALPVTRNEPDLIKYIIHNKVGNGPEVLTEGHLLDEQGKPVKQPPLKLVEKKPPGTDPNREIRMGSPEPTPKETNRSESKEEIKTESLDANLLKTEPSGSTVDIENKQSSESSMEIKTEPSVSTPQVTNPSESKEEIKTESLDTNLLKTEPSGSTVDNEIKPSSESTMEIKTEPSVSTPQVTNPSESKEEIKTESLDTNLENKQSEIEPPEPSKE